MYLFMESYPAGLLMLMSSGRRPKILDMEIDYDLGEKCLQNAEMTEKAVADHAIPERAEYGNYCEMCDYHHICNPQKQLAELTTEEEAAFYPDLSRYVELQTELEQPQKEFNILKRKLVGNKQSPGPFRGKNRLIDDIMVTSAETDSGQIRTKIEKL
jgi:hypothetical protein